MGKKLLDKFSETQMVIGSLVFAVMIGWGAFAFIDSEHEKISTVLADDLKKQSNHFQKKLDVFSRSALRVQMAGWIRELGELAVIEKVGGLTPRDIKRMVELENLLDNARIDLGDKKGR